MTERLLEAFKAKDRDPVIQYLAWEALHARHASLSPDQRRRWATGGLKAAVGRCVSGGDRHPVAAGSQSTSRRRSKPSRCSSRCVVS